MGQRLRISEVLRQAFIPELRLPERLSNVVVGYRFAENDTTEISYEIYAVCPNGRVNEWKLQFYSRALVTELFVPVAVESVSSSAEHTVTKRRVRVKMREEQNTDERPITDERSEQGS